MTQQARPIYEIAEEISREWENVSFGAVPYLGAMFSLNRITDNYMVDSAKTIIIYFLLNATGWRGPKAREIKSELKQIAGVK